jgi:hypothetical protein
MQSKLTMLNTSNIPTLNFEQTEHLWLVRWLWLRLKHTLITVITTVTRSSQSELVDKFWTKKSPYFYGLGNTFLTLLFI